MKYLSNSALAHIYESSGQTPMPYYIDRHAELYDLFYQNKPYEEEAKFVIWCLREHGTGSIARLLEIACGTGKHARQFALEGFDVTATDNSSGMLQVAKRNAEIKDLRVHFQQADMRRLPAPPLPFDAAICLFDSIGYAQTEDGVNDVLRGVRANLRPGGLFIFEFWHARAMLAHYEPVRVKRFAVPEGMILRISETTLLRQESLARVNYTIYELRNDQTFQHLAETHMNRFFHVSEMSSLAAQNNFEPCAYYAGFDTRGQITEETWHVIAVWKSV